MELVLVWLELVLEWINWVVSERLDEVDSLNKNECLWTDLFILTNFT